MFHFILALFFSSVIVNGVYASHANKGLDSSTAKKAEEEPEEGFVKPLHSTNTIVRTIEDALKACYRNNPELVQIRHEFLATVEGVQQSKAEFLPRITGEVGATYGESIASGTQKNIPAKGSGSTTNQVAGSLALTQNLFNGWASVAQLRSAELDVVGRMYQMKSKEQEVFLTVIEIFLEIIRLKGDIEALRASERAVQTNLEVAQNKLTIGEETRTQVALAESRVADVQARIQISTAALRSARAAFVSLTGCEAADNLLEPAIPESNIQKIDTVLANLESNLDVMIAHTAYAQAKANVDRTKGQAWFPTVDLTARSTRSTTRSSANFFTDRITTQSNDRETSNSIGVSVKYDLFSGGASTSKLNQAHSTSASRRVAVETARYRVRSQLVKSWENYHASRLNIESFKRQVEASQVSLEGMRQEMAAGIRILLDLLQRQSELLDAQRKLIEARKNLLLEGFRLMSLMGRLNVDKLQLPVKKFETAGRVETIKSDITKSIGY